MTYRTDCIKCGNPDTGVVRFDARGIFITRQCDECWKISSKSYRPEVLTDPGYDLMGETLEPDDWQF